MSSPPRDKLAESKRKKKNKEIERKTHPDPLTQTNTRHTKPESVDHCKKKKKGEKRKKKKNSINYLIRNLESHTISQRELRSELVIYFLVYLWEAAMQPVLVVQCRSRV